jgi:hypothetical protein
VKSIIKVTEVGSFVTVGVYGDGKEYVTEEAIGRIFDADGNLMSEGKILVLWKKNTSRLENVQGLL